MGLAFSRGAGAGQFLPGSPAAVGRRGAAAEGARGAAMGRTPPARRPEGGGWGFLLAPDKRTRMTSPARGKTSHRFISVS